MRPRASAALGPCSLRNTGPGTRFSHDRVPSLHCDIAGQRTSNAAAMQKPCPGRCSLSGAKRHAEVMPLHSAHVQDMSRSAEAFMLNPAENVRHSPRTDGPHPLVIAEFFQRGDAFVHGLVVKGIEHMWSIEHERCNRSLDVHLDVVMGHCACSGLSASTQTDTRVDNDRCSTGRYSRHRSPVRCR